MNIKELAEQAGLYEEPNGDWKPFASEHVIGKDLERFAELVAEQTHTNNKAKWYQEGYEAGQHDERESCAKLCDDEARQSGSDHEAGGMYWCAEKIRAREEK